MIESLEVAVLNWAEERGIFESGTPFSQFRKTEEEVTELHAALLCNDKGAVKDAIGDIVVTLIIQAHMHGLSLGQCLASAYHEIKDRKGKMVGGVFVKEE